MHVRAFSLLETLLMLVALGVFTLLLAGMTKSFWQPSAPAAASIPSSTAPAAR